MGLWYNFQWRSLSRLVKTVIFPLQADYSYGDSVTWIFINRELLKTFKCLLYTGGHCGQVAADAGFIV